MKVLRNKCPHCKKGNLDLIPGVFPWSTDHFMCDICDSTFTLDFINKEVDRLDEELVLKTSQS